MQQGAVPYDPDSTPPSHPQSSTLREAMRAVQKRAGALKGVTGIGEGADEIGNPAVVVYVEQGGLAGQFPARVGGVAVRTVVTGTIDAQAGTNTGQTRRKPPVNPPQ